MSSYPELFYDFHLVIPHATEAMVFLVVRDGKLRLPYLNSSISGFGSAWRINRAIHELYGISTTVRICIEEYYDPNTKTVHAIYLLNNHSPFWSPPSEGQWVSFEIVEKLELDLPWWHNQLTRWLTGTTLQTPWSKAGWLHGAIEWILAQLSQEDLLPVAPIEQRRAWQRSCILRVETKTGDIYFKALPKMFSHEILLLSDVMLNFPINVPDFLALDPDRNWMLMRDISGIPLMQVSDTFHFDEALLAYSCIQHHYIQQTSQLIRMGCPYRSLEKLSKDIRILFSDDATMLVGSSIVGLSKQEFAELQTRTAYFVELCDQLEQYKLPYTIDHGDLHGNNIHFANNRYVFFDWSDSSVTHPFLGIFSFVQDFQKRSPQSINAYHRLRDVYLSTWKDYCSLDELRKAFDLALPLSIIHRAVTHYQYILPYFDNKTELQWFVPWWIRQLLRNF